jgi:RNA polymerase-binding transcription factor DksA
LPDYDPKEVEARLNARLEEIDRVLNKIVVRGDEQAGELADYDQHPADTATETFEQEMDESKRAILEDERAQVELALERLREGKYGYSIESGEEIPAERLEAMPEAVRTVEEQRRYEATRGGPTGPGPAR